jgi:hypothetical protein
VFDVDTPQEEVSFRVSGLPSQGTLKEGGVPLSVGVAVAIGDVLTYEPDEGAEGTDVFSLVGWDGADETPVPAEVKVFLGRFTAVIHVVNGWNALALPLQPDTPLLSDLLAGTGYVDAPLRFNGHHWVPVAETTPGEGFVVFCEGLPAEGSDIAVPGTAVASVILLTPGWHMRGGIGHQTQVDYVPERVEGGDYGPGWLYQTDEMGKVTVPTGMSGGQACWYRVATPGDVDFSLNKPQGQN